MSKPSTTNYPSSQSQQYQSTSSKYNKSSTNHQNNTKLGKKIILPIADELKSKECLDYNNDFTQNALKQQKELNKNNKLNDDEEKVNPHNNNNKKDTVIENVWSTNLVQCMEEIEEIIEDYPYVAMDTEFPGVVARPVDSFRHWLGYAYRLISSNVNMLKLIQLGLTFYNINGEKYYKCYQFNFKFSISSDMFAPDSIQLLIKSGIDFVKLSKIGINHELFSEIITMSGLVLNDDIRWICFHGSYDFSYLIKILCNRDLPKNEKEFFYLLEKYFPYIYDIKVLLRNVHSIKGGGLSNLANILLIKRIGNTHQAGSDSLLTGDCFFKLRELYFEELMDDKKYLNTLYGLGNYNFVKSHDIWYYN